VPDDIREMLDERPAAGDVDQLHAATDSEQREIPIDRGPGQRDLDGVALGHDVNRLGMRRLAIRFGIDVRPAREHERVDEIERLGGFSTSDGRAGS